jgi:hypothetical protein
MFAHEAAKRSEHFEEAALPSLAFVCIFLYCCAILVHQTVTRKGTIEAFSALIRTSRNIPNDVSHQDLEVWTLLSTSN